MQSKTILINAFIFIIVAVLTYGATLYFDRQSPKIIVQNPQSLAQALPATELAPDFTFTAMDGKTYALRDFKSKVIILNFWASWCPPCVKEFPDLLKLAAAFPEDTVLIALSSDIDAASMNRFLQKQNIKQAANIYIVLDKDQKVTREIFQTYRLPETILIDGDQYLRQKIPGADWRFDEMAGSIAQLIQKSAN